MLIMMINFLSNIVTRCRQTFLSVGLFSLLINLLMLTVSIYMMQVFDRVLASGSGATLVYLTLIAVGAIALLAGLDAVRTRLLGRASLWLEHKLAPATFGRAVESALTDQPYRTEALRDLGTLRSALSGPAVLALVDAPWVPIYLAVIYLLHPLLGHIALAGALGLFSIALLNHAATQHLLHQANAASVTSLHRAEASVRNAEVVDAMGLLPGLTQRWAGIHDVGLVLHARAGDRAAVIQALSRFSRLAVQIALLGAGAWLVLQHELTGGAMIAGSIIMGRALAPVEQAIGTWKQVVAAREAYRRLTAFFARPAYRPDGMPLPAPRGHLTVENLSYGVPGKPPILRSISFALPSGEALAIIGPSAAGKSTLARLLVGSRKPNAGTVRLDGADLFTWPRAEIGRYVGYLPQDVELFAGTVRENIARLTEADPARIVEAAQMAQAHDLILRLPDGYDTQIGEQGTILSAGQRQRIALARALFGQPRLIVLDEPNANLDSEGEEALCQAIAAIKQTGAAVIVIGHRPSTLAQVDKVLVLRQGTVELFGPRQAVLDRLAARNVTALRPRPMPAEAFPAAQCEV
jgi:PrtD family type I secretion system ABC transporter